MNIVSDLTSLLKRTLGTATRSQFAASKPSPSVLVTTSREWIKSLLADYPQLERHRSKVPAAIKMLL